MKTPRFIKVCWSTYIWAWEVDVRTDHQHFDGVTDCAGRLACINHISSTKQILSWRKIAIALTDPDFGEQKAQSCAIACLRQLIGFPDLETSCG